MTLRPDRSRIAAPAGGGTRVDLVHSGWERFDDPQHATSSEYGGERGWNQVLGRYAEAVAG